MDFKAPYVMAMSEQAPKMFMRLRRTGALDKHLQDKSIEAHRMYDELTVNAPKLASGQPAMPYHQIAERQVMETLIEFPPDEDETEPTDPLGKENR